MTEIHTRRECLEQATECVTQDRCASYGEPEDNFKNIADIWNAQGVRMYADSHGAFRDEHREVNATDVALMMVGMKLARLRFNPAHKDSWVDMAGYAACGMECALKPASEFVPAPTNRIEPLGWVSDNRCGLELVDGNKVNGTIGARPHPAHSYGRDKGQWCDGYI